MSGHSRWSTIKRKKGAADARRGKIFSKLIKEISVAARSGGDPDMNPRLRSAMNAARAQNMPTDNIERAIKRGTGEIEGAHYEEASYEGYGPAGVAVLVDVMTDNRQRTVSEIRHIFTRNNGALGEAGCVAWNFETKGIIAVEKTSVSEEKLMEVALNAGADDIRDEGNNFEIISEAAAFEEVRKSLEQQGIKPVLAEVAKIPKTTVPLTGRDAEIMIKLIDALEENEDVQHVYSNSDIPAEVMEKVASQA